jgi:hypothetical protein
MPQGHSTPLGRPRVQDKVCLHTAAAARNRGLPLRAPAACRTLRIIAGVITDVRAMGVTFSAPGGPGACATCGRSTVLYILRTLRELRAARCCRHTGGRQLRLVSEPAACGSRCRRKVRGPRCPARPPPKPRRPKAAARWPSRARKVAHPGAVPPAPPSPATLPRARARGPDHPAAQQAAPRPRPRPRPRRPPPAAVTRTAPC